MSDDWSSRPLSRSLPGEPSADAGFESHTPQTRRSMLPVRAGWRRLGMWRYLGVATLAVVTSYGVGFAVGSRGRDHRAAPAPSTAVAPAEPTAGATNTASTSISPSTSVTDSGTPSAVTHLEPLLDNDHDWGLFVAEQSNQSGVATIRRIDLANGDITDVPGKFTDGLAVVTGSGSQSRVLSASDVGGADVLVPGPDGDVWAAAQRYSSGDARGQLRLIRPASGSSRVIASFDMASLGISFLVGSNSDGYPVYIGGDGAFYVFEFDAQHSTRIATGALLGAFAHGNFSTVNCDLAGACSITIHGGANTMTIDYEQDLDVSIAPDGSHALLTRRTITGRSVQMVDLQSGTLLTTLPVAGAGDNVSVSVTWSPDGHEAFVLTDRRIIVLGNDDTPGRYFQLADDFQPADALVGIA